MNKHFIVLVTTILFLTVGLSGCEEVQTDNGSNILGDTDELELVNYTIETYNNNHEKIGDGFVHDSKAYSYEITGTVKNIAGKFLNRSYTGARFYDNNNNYLNYKMYSTPNLAKNSTANFSMIYASSDEYFEKVHSVKFYLFVIME